MASSLSQPHNEHTLHVAYHITSDFNVMKNIKKQTQHRRPSNSYLSTTAFMPNLHTLKAIHCHTKLIQENGEKKMRLMKYMRKRPVLNENWNWDLVSLLTD